VLLLLAELPLRCLDPAQHAFVLGPRFSQRAISPERMFPVADEWRKR
jgi:hypothetical protein